MMKKIIGLTLALVMVLGMVQVPVSAAETQIFSINFDNLVAGKSARGQSNISGTPYTRSYYFNDDLDTSSKLGSVSQSSVSTVTIEERSAGNNAMKFVSKYEFYDKARVENYFNLDEPIATVASTDILHFGFDFMTEDMNVFKSFSYKFDNWEWDFLKFDTDGTIKLWNKVVCAYTINTWYDVDIYYNASNDIYHLFIDDEYINSVYDSTTCTKVAVARIEGTFDTETDAQTIFWVDNVKFNKVEAADMVTKLPTFRSSFNYLTAGESYTSATVLNDITNTTDDGSIQKNADITVTVDSRGAYDNALKFVAAGNSIGTDSNGNPKSRSTYMHGVVKLAITEGDVIHVGLDFKTEDMNCDKSLMLREFTGANFTGQSDNWNFLKFKADGTVLFNWTTDEYVIDTYEVNTWYNYDLYFDTTINKWYIFVNDVLKAEMSVNKEYTGIGVTRFSWGPPEGKTTVVYLDNMEFGKVTSAKLASLMPAAPAKDALTAVKNTVDGKQNVFVNAQSPENLSGTVIAALYDGTELVEIITFDARSRKYIRFAETGTEAKVMWWNSDTSDITPKVVAIPVSFATPAN